MPDKMKPKQQGGLLRRFRGIFCTHYYGYFRDASSPAFFFRPRRRVFTPYGYRKADDLDPAAVSCLGCGYRFFETSVIRGSIIGPLEVVEENLND